MRSLLQFRVDQSCHLLQLIYDAWRGPVNQIRCNKAYPVISHRRDALPAHPARPLMFKKARPVHGRNEKCCTPSLPPFFPRRMSCASGFAKVSWLTFILLAVPSHPSEANSGILAAFVTITVAGRRELSTPFPLSETNKKPQTDYSAWGCPFFILKPSLCLQPDKRGSQNTIFLVAGLLAPPPF